MTSPAAPAPSLYARLRAWDRRHPRVGMAWRVAVVFAAFSGFLCLLAWLFRPDMSKVQAILPPSEWPADVERPIPAIDPDPAKRLRLHVEVNYDEGPAAAWFPKGEPPVLKPLVEQGKLPPIAERTGPEPCVYRPVDGIGKQGGTWFSSGSSPEDLMYRMTACTLLRWSPQGHPVVPHVAKSYTVTPDYKRYVFTLRKGMRWSDGTPFSAHDIQFWWDREVNDKATGTARPQFMYPRGKPGRVKALDDLHIQFEFDDPHGLFPERLASARGIPMLNSPRHYLTKYHPTLGDQKLIAERMHALRINSKRDLYAQMKLVSNTEHPRLWPWLYRTFTPNPPFSYVRNPYFWMVDTEGNQLPYVDRILAEKVSPDMMPASIVSGRFPLSSSKTTDATLILSGRKSGNYRIYRWVRADASDAMIHVNLNRAVDPADPSTKWKHQLLNDKRFRQALSHAIDRKQIIDANYCGETFPCQVAPQPFSAFHHPKLYNAFVEHNPARANQLLDECGLDKRDAEGMRTFPDGSRMTFFLNHMGWLRPSTVQFVAFDWAKVGVRTIPRLLEQRLFYTEKAALLQDFTMWTGENEYFPLLTMRCFLPAEEECNFAMGYARWYARGGLNGNPEANQPGHIPVPPGHPLRKGLELYDELLGTGDFKRQKELMDGIMDIAAENLWTINICSSPMFIMTVSNNFMNVPKQVTFTFTFIAPGNTGQETYSFREIQDPPAAVEAIRKEIMEVTTELGEKRTAAAQPKDAPAATPASEKNWVGTAVQWLLIGILVLFLLLTAVRHPFVARRLLIMIPTLLIISLAVFVIIELPPGDYLTKRMAELEVSGEPLAEERLKELRDLYHLDDPFVVRYLRWMGFYWFASFDRKDEGLIQGHLGRSMANDNKEVNKLVGDRISLTVIVSFVTILVTWLIALPIGIYSAVKQYSWGDYALTLFGFVGMCIPSFLLALILMYLSKEYLGLHVDRLFSPKYALQPYWDFGKVVDLLKHIWVPVVVLGIGGTAGMIRVMRANLLDELRKPYVTTARAKGVRPLKLLLKYPVRLALNPFISSIGGIFPALVSGSVLVAVVLSLPLVGPLMLDALLNEDTMLAGSMLMVLSALGIFGVLVSDLLLLWLDPRIRFEGGSR